MKRKFFRNLALIVILGFVLLTLTGCKNEKNTKQQIVNDTEINNNIEINDTNNNSVLPTIDIEEIDFSPKQNETLEVQVPEEAQGDENISLNNQNITETDKKEDVEIVTEQNSKFNVGKFEYEYGTYQMSISDAVIDGNLVFPDVFVEIKKDGTYVLTSDYQSIIPDHTGTWSVDDSKLYLKHGNEIIEYQSLYNNSFVNKRGYLEYKEK